ncbi:YtxH domain-containing protein [Bacillus xiapuensis]|uniref:YtxH domain-containing protein n=1 Tax=Bacillus xiapuensis TaxID=2014075 RepID=UPI000C2481CC|nr:YtxH domain-containing protein [Bacillus xiapuensis]
MKKTNPNYESFELNTNYDDANMNTKDFFIGALIGGMVGAAAALLLAPKSGKELRDDLNLQAGSLKERASDWADMAKEKSGGLATAARSKTSSLAKAVQEQSDAALNKAKTIAPSSSSQSNSSEAEGLGDAAKEAMKETAATVSDKLEETKKIFDETEKNIGQSKESSKPASSAAANPADVKVNEKKTNGGQSSRANTNKSNHQQNSRSSRNQSKHNQK